MSQEIYRRDLQKRPTKETYKRDLQKRPTKDINKTAFFFGACISWLRRSWNEKDISKETHKRHRSPTKEAH